MNSANRMHNCENDLFGRNIYENELEISTRQTKMNNKARYILVEGACLLIAIMGLIYILPKVTEDYIRKSSVSISPETGTASTTTEYDGNLSAGTYQIGKDIPAGEYDITLVSGNGNVIAYSSGLNAVLERLHPVN